MAIAVPNVPGDDLSAMRHFYVDLLGFNVLFEATEDGARGLMGLELVGMRLHIDCPMEGHGRQICVSLEVEDVDAWYQRWSPAIPNLPAPINQDWGSRTFGFQDPADNTIYVLGPIS